ncbi:MAG: hypothetical protein QM753_01205 [Thermomicrobiales bacterium]
MELSRIVRAWAVGSTAGAHVLLGCLLVLMVAGLGVPAHALADATPEPNGSATIAFSVSVCPPHVTAFPDVMQADGLPNCDGTGLAGGEAPLANGFVALYAVETGDEYSLVLDGNGYAEITVPGGLTYVASYGADSVTLQSRSVCGSAMSGLAGASEAGVLVSSGEAMSCTALTLSPNTQLGASAIALTVRGCPNVADASGFLIGDGVLDCNGDSSVDESVPFSGGTATFTNTTTGEAFSATIDGSGVANSGPVSNGDYTVALASNGASLSFAGVCGGTAANGSPLGLAGGIGNGSAPIRVQNGESLSCSILVALGQASKPSAPSVVSVTVLVRTCEPAFDVAAAALSADVQTMAQYDKQFADHCTTQSAFKGQAPATLKPLADGYGMDMKPGSMLGVAIDPQNSVLWSSCQAVGEGQRPLLFSPLKDKTMLALEVPTTFMQTTMTCTVYLAPEPAG